MVIILFGLIGIIIFLMNSEFLMIVFLYPLKNFSIGTFLVPLEDINSINKFWKNSKVYKPNLKKEIINRKIRKWKFAINLLIKYYS